MTGPGRRGDGEGAGYQTSGGLLAIVPAERAAGLAAAIPGASVIGEVVAGEPVVTVD